MKMRVAPAGLLQNPALKDLYQQSNKVYRDTINGARSETLRELYTDTFRPETIKSYMTTVKDLRTGEPVEVFLDSVFTDGTSIHRNHRLRNSLLTKDKTVLGTKTFGFEIGKGKPTEFTGGYIHSRYNDDVAGTQIRLLQSAVETADKNGVHVMPLTSLLPAVKFHTMMGFRPEKTFNVEVKTVADVERVMNENAIDFHKAGFTNREVVPILSEKDGKLFFDRNRTFYCASMKHNEKLLRLSHKRNLKYLNNSDEAINMTLEGKEFNDWLRRIKGFEILPDGEISPRKGNKFQEILRFVIEILRS